MTTQAAATPDPLLRSATGKFFRRMVPLLVFMLLVNQMDRTNISFVQKHLHTDIGLSAGAFGLGAGLFFVAYAIFEVPSNMLLERFGARVWLTRIMISWGVVVLATAFVGNAYAFYALRFLLGVAEAGFFPGVLYYFTKWLPNQQRGRATTIFLAGSATAAVVTGPISGALLELDGAGGLAGWKWMFLLEGALSVLVGIAAAFFLVSRIDDAKWLTADEKSALSAAVAADEEIRDQAEQGVSRWRLILHPQVLLLCWIFFAMTITGYAITFWLPELVGRIPGLSDFQTGVLSAIPPLCSVLAMYPLARATDRSGNRRGWVIIMMVITAAGTFLTPHGTPWFGFVFLCVTAMGNKCAATAYWPMAQHGLELRIAAPGLALVNSLGNLGGFVAPTIFGYLQDTTGSTTGGLYGLSVVSLIGAVTVLLFRQRGGNTPAAPAVRPEVSPAG